ncbi:MAG: tRNA pseudouridine(55) synthase TruB [Gemmatimonadota bacterium]
MSGTPVDPLAPCVLLVDKPEGPTSHDVVQRARRALATRRIGHTGTLDPFASGLLLLCVGSATRLVEFFQPLPKAYDAELMLGTETTTHDRMGEVVASGNGWRRVGESHLREVLAEHTGVQQQRPPAYSAVRVGGRRAHELARAGEPLFLAERAVLVRSLDLLEFAPPAARLRIVASTGTYVRSLARDIGRRLGCGAYLSALRRTSIGPFRVDSAARAGELEAATIPSGARLSPSRALSWLPSRELAGEEAERAANGGSVSLGELRPPEIRCEVLAGDGADPPPVRLLSEGRLLGVASRDGSLLRPLKIFHER